MTQDNTETIIGIDLTDDEKSQRWMTRDQEDDRERFSEWSDEKAQRRLHEVCDKLRDLCDESANE